MGYVGSSCLHFVVPCFGIVHSCYICIVYCPCTSCFGCSTVDGRADFDGRVDCCSIVGGRVDCRSIVVGRVDCRRLCHRSGFVGVESVFRKSHFCDCFGYVRYPPVMGVVPLYIGLHSFHPIAGAYGSLRCSPCMGWRMIDLFCYVQICYLFFCYCMQFRDFADHLCSP